MNAAMSTSRPPQPPRPAPLTEAMKRELRSYARDGNPSDPFDWSHAPDGLWFHARERVIDALRRRGLLADDEHGRLSITEAGKQALRNLGDTDV